MARRSPAAVRAALPPRFRPGIKFSVVDGLSTQAVREIQAIERRRLGPGSVARAIAEWKRVVYRRDVPAMLEDAVHHGLPCCDPAEAREVLDQALSLLGPSVRRELLAQVGSLDEIFRRRTIHDPHALAGQPWWRQRV